MSNSFIDESPAKAERPTFPCESCAGTGFYRGVRVHQAEVICFACKGRGFYFVSYQDRMAKRAKAAARKQAKAASAAMTNWEGFVSAEPTMAAWIIGRAEGFDFAKAMKASVEKWGHLTAGQAAAVGRMIEGDKVRAEERARKDAEAAKAATSANVALATSGAVDAIKDALHKAASKGLKHPKLRFEGFEVSEAKATSKNAGALYITAGGYGSAYYGKIVGGVFTPSWEAKAASGLIDAVAAAMANPVEQARAYGKRTGNCSCCGRELTDPVSVERGIGPVCESKYF